MIIRIAGINIPENKQIPIALSCVYGIGVPLALRILKELNIDPKKKTKDLQEEEIVKLRQVIENKYKIEGELRREILGNIKRLKEIKCWRGTRHSKRLPARGQKTRKNARTVRGRPKITVGSGRRKAPAPK